MFNPGEHTAAEVLAYLDGAYPALIGRVLAAERRGLARPEILSAFPQSLGGRRLV